MCGVGHTHFSCDFWQDDVRVIANQRGGARQANASGFDHEMTVEM